MNADCVSIPLTHFEQGSGREGNSDEEMIARDCFRTMRRNSSRQIVCLETQLTSWFPMSLIDLISVR
jgi:hypothetical protein